MERKKKKEIERGEKNPHVSRFFFFFLVRCSDKRANSGCLPGAN